MTNNEILLNNIEQIKDLKFDEQKTLKFGVNHEGIGIQDIRKEWDEIIESKRIDVKSLYEKTEINDWEQCKKLISEEFSFEDEIYSLLVNWLETIDWDDYIEARALYYYVEIMCSSDYRFNSKAILKYHNRLHKAIKHLSGKSDFKIVADLFKSGCFSDFMENLVNLYYHHSLRSWETMEDVSEYDKIMQDTSLLLPSIIKNFPSLASSMMLSFLELHPKPIETYAHLLYFYMKDGSFVSCPLASDMFSFYNDPSDFFYKKSPNIIQTLLKKHKPSNNEISYLIDFVILSQFNLCKEFLVNDLETHIVSLELHYNSEKLIPKYKKDLKDLHLNWDKKFKAAWFFAVRRLAVSKPSMKCVEMIKKAYPTHPKMDLLNKLIDEAHEFQNSPKLFDINTKPTTVFKDFGMKLLVIEELMYKQKVLKPAFNIDEFVKEYTKKEIEIHTCEEIPEVKKFFKNLDIPSELLTKVKSLYQDSGVSGGSDFIYQIFPDWDPGAGDEVYKVTNKAIEDLQLLPNLELIIGLEISKPSKKILNVLQTNGVILEEEDD